MIGVVSYLLINFWFTRILANKAAIQAVIINKVGDYMFMLGICYFILIFGNLNITTGSCVSPYIDNNIITFIMLFFFIAAMAKSAQLGLHTWLPNAMEGFYRALLKFHYLQKHLKKLNWSDQFFKWPLCGYLSYLGQLHGKIQFMRKFAGNQNRKFDLEESSETIREIYNNVY